MFGVKTNQGWMTPTGRPSSYWLNREKVYPFKDHKTAEKAAREWLALTNGRLRFTIHKAG